MTMRLTKDQQIGGMAATEARHLLRKCDGGFRADWVEDELFRLWCKRKFAANLDWDKARQACRREAARRIKALLTDGFIQLDGDTKSWENPKIPWYKLTDSGEELSRATAAKPVHRKNAEETLRGFMERVRIVNEGDHFLYRVTVVVVYGSYVRGAERPADVDLAIKLERKISDPEEYRKAEAVYLKDREFRSFMDRLIAPLLDVKSFLKQRKRTLSLHGMDDFIGMEKHENFSYEVLLGDEDKITQMLAEEEEEEEEEERSR